MFDFVVKYLGFLKHVPFLPHVFDSQYKLWLFISGSVIPRCLDDIEAEVLSWNGTSAALHKYGGIQYNVTGAEIGHVHSNGILDVLFSKKIKRQLMQEGRVSDHHVFKKSGWTTFYIKNKEDGEYAKALLRMAYLIKDKKCRPASIIGVS